MQQKSTVYQLWKNILHFKNSINCIDKAPKTWKRRKFVYFP
ncbi:hypothetical protein [Wolbachia endosymbiont of Litomosoides brasiliensis]|nr:hypothetical protein [Wolbachia endosymbiont of Litomosoides brasiliensis]